MIIKRCAEKPNACYLIRVPTTNHRHTIFKIDIRIFGIFTAKLAPASSSTCCLAISITANKTKIWIRLVDDQGIDLIY